MDEPRKTVPSASARTACGRCDTARPAPTAGRLSQVERATILATLAECGENRTHAAKKLGISRRALIYKIRAIEAEGRGESAEGSTEY